jgi:hypothetical protein
MWAGWAGAALLMTESSIRRIMGLPASLDAENGLDQNKLSVQLKLA